MWKRVHALHAPQLSNYPSHLHIICKAPDRYRAWQATHDGQVRFACVMDSNTAMMI